MPNKTYKVIKIINDYELVVNAGSNNGIGKDESLEVFILGEEITDPETGESLGTLDTIKAYLNVKHVYPKMSICENADSHITNAFAGWAEAFEIRNRKRLNIDSAEISGGQEEAGKIRIGDLVRRSKN